MRAESAADGMAGGDIVHSSKRQEMKELIEEFRKINPNIENNIFKSVSNVNLDACIGYVKNGKRHHFLEAVSYTHLRKVILSHYPMICYNGQYRRDEEGRPRSYMLYGHVHDTFEMCIRDRRII